MRLLAPGGLLIFSNNQRKFTIDPELQEQFSVEDKTAWSMDKDFQRSKTIHQCWFITNPD
jgi:23S rRNA (guanine2445-N2)-methyltransferase / 23S rRNA (guanine2069-N7)-methyltransferase